MNLPNIVCPYNAELLDRLKGRFVVLRVKDTDSIAEAATDVAQSGNRLRQMIVETELPLDEIEYPDEWQNIPISLQAASPGRFRHLVKKLDAMRNLNLCVYVSCCNHGNMSGLRILSSVGIPCGVSFDKGGSDWEALADLMTYAVLERTPHAPIEPFTYIARNYKAGAYTDWGRVYFDDPGSFLHLDEQGRVALSPGDLNNKQFIADDYFSVDESLLTEAIERRSSALRQCFVENRTCARCVAWRVCLGKFDPGTDEAVGCASFFTEMMEVAEQYRSEQDRRLAR